MARDTKIVGRSGGLGQLHRLTPDPRVLFGLGTLVALLAGAVAVAVFLIVSVEDDTTRLSERHVQYATSIQEAALNAKGIANNERGFLISGNAEFLDELEERTIEVQEAFAAAKRHAVGTREREAAEQASAGFQRWLRALRRQLAVYRAGAQQRAVRMSLGPTRDLRLTYERSLARAQRLGLRSIESATSSVSASASRSVTILLVYLAAAVLIGVGVALWVVRAILRPTHELTQKAWEVLTRGRVLVEEGPHGSHYGVSVEVPIEVVNALAESAREAEEGLRGSGGAA